MVSRRIVSPPALLTLLLFTTPAQTEQPPAAGEPAPPTAAEVAIHRARLEAGKIVDTSVEPAARAGQASLPQKPPPQPPPPPERLHPRLIAWLEQRDRNEIVRIVISFKDSVKIPRFPSLDPRFRREDSENAQVLATAEALVRSLEKERAPMYDRLRQELEGPEKLEAKVRETFWLTAAVVAEIPLRRVRELAGREDVLAIAPVDSGEPPPHDEDPDNDVEKGRAKIASDPYFGLGWNYIGLLDTGVRASHRQFDAPSTLGRLRDCVKGGADCNAGEELNPDDDCWNHGTSTAAILTGNNRAGSAYRGVTAFIVDSFKVYPTSFDDLCNCNGTIDRSAAQHGFQAAVRACDKVIVAEMQGNYLGDIALQANAAFDAGVVVVAPVGNSRATVGEPANASRVLGVGSFDVAGKRVEIHGHGKDQDRIKPEFQAPTNTETASNGCDFARNCHGVGSPQAFRIYSGTSGATPYAAGAAALLRNFVSRVMGTTNVDPGLVYASMILSGQEPRFDSRRGTGPLQLPTDGTLRWGMTLVDHQQTLEVPIPLAFPQGQLDAAIWWPESGMPGDHNDIDLVIVDPAGVEQFASRSIPSVFERARSKISVSGTWKVQIQGIRVGAPQRVYFAILNQ